MLLFLSSGARNRYREDIVRSLALPEGGFLQFRYELAIVDQRILDSVKSGQLLNRDVIVCYVSTLPEGVPTDFVPCRFARITSAEIVGSSFVVRFQVAGYPQLGKNMKFISLLSQEDQRKLPQWERAEGEEKLKLNGLFSISLTGPPTLTSSRELDAFESIVKRLHKFPDFSGDRSCQFFSVMDVSLVKRDARGLEVYDRQLLSLHGSFVIKSGAEYEMKVYVFAPDFGPAAAVNETSIRIESENKLLEFPQGKVQEIDSEYDIKRFRFVTEKAVYPFSAALTLFIGPVDARSCDITIPAVFEGDFQLATIKIALVTIGSSIPAMLAAQAADKLSLGLALLMLIAAAATGVGTVFFASRKG